MEHNNDHLHTLLAQWSNTQDPQDYRAVFDALHNDEGYLLVPANYSGNVQQGVWTAADADQDITLTCIATVDGKKTMMVFTNEEALRHWSKDDRSYVALPSREVLLLSAQNNIDTLIINIHQPKMYILNRMQ